MKKIFGLFFTLTILSSFSNISFAVFPAGDLGDPISVVANFSNKGDAELSIKFFNISNDEELESAQINWKVQDIIFPKKDDTTDQWKWSTTYAVITANVTKPNIKFYLYQKNLEGSDYKADITKPRTNGDGTKVYSGLVNKDLDAFETGEYGAYVPLNFLFTANKLSDAELKSQYDPKKYDPGEGSKVDDKVSRYFKDIADSDFGTNYTYTLIACANTGGIAFYPYGEYGPWSPSSVIQSKTAYMYFGGNFITLLRDYPDFGTEQIVIEKVVE